MIEVKKNVDDLNTLSAEIDGHGVPLTVEDEIGAGKLGIIVSCERMSGRSLDLHVSVRKELLTCKIGELVSLVLLYSTVYKVIEGDLGYESTCILIVYSKSELGEMNSLIAIPRNASREVECLNLATVIAVSILPPYATL